MTKINTQRKSKFGHGHKMARSPETRCPGSTEVFMIQPATLLPLVIWFPAITEPSSLSLRLMNVTDFWGSLKPLLLLATRRKWGQGRPKTEINREEVLRRAWEGKTCKSAMNITLLGIICQNILGTEQQAMYPKCRFWGQTSWGQVAMKCLKKAKDLISSRLLPVPTERNNPNRRFLHWSRNASKLKQRIFFFSFQDS